MLGNGAARVLAGSASGGRAVRWAGPPWAQTPRKCRVHAWRPRGVHRSASASLLCLHHLQTGSNTAQRGAQHHACPEPARASSRAHRCCHCSMSEPDPQASYTPQGPDCRWSRSWAHTASRPPAAQGTAGPGPRDRPGLPPRAVSARKQQDLRVGGPRAPPAVQRASLEPSAHRARKGLPVIPHCFPSSFH